MSANNEHAATVPKPPPAFLLAIPKIVINGLAGLLLTRTGSTR
jgi:hypothetical protein